MKQAPSLMDWLWFASETRRRASMDTLINRARWLSMRSLVQDFSARVLFLMDWLWFASETRRRASTDSSISKARWLSIRSLITRLGMRRDWLQFGLVPMTMASGDTLVGNWGWVY